MKKNIMIHKTKDENRRLAFEKRNVKKEMNLARYGAEGGSALVMAKTSDFYRRFLAAFMSLVFAISCLVVGINFATRAEELSSNDTVVPEERSLSNLVLDKKISAQPDGTYTLQLSAYAKGGVKQITKQVPTDYVLVVDQSSSMATQDMPTKYIEAERPADGWTFESFVGGTDADGNAVDKELYYYDNKTDNYYRVYRKWGALYELVPRNSMYVRQILDKNGLRWFQKEETQEQNIYSSYYYQPKSDPLIAKTDPAVKDDGHFYPISINARGAKLSYFITLKYKDISGNTRTAKFYNGDHTNSDWTKDEALYYWNAAGGDFTPTDNLYERLNNAVVYHSENNSITGTIAVALGNTQQAKTGHSNYTYAEIDASPIFNLNTGMYIQNPLFIGHVGYNAIAYRDSAGEEHILDRTDYCNSNGNQTLDEEGKHEFKNTDLVLYEPISKESEKTRLEATQDALAQFASYVAKQTEDEIQSDGSIVKKPVDHRIAIVGFSSNGYNNNELLTNTAPGFQVQTTSWTHPGSTTSTGYSSWDNNAHDGIQQSDATNYYSTALVSARDENAEDNVNEAVTEGIMGLTAFGGTNPDTGLDMAYEILRQNDKSQEYASGDRNAVVIFFTDGRPQVKNGNTTTSLNQYMAANNVVGSAHTIKNNIEGVRIYSVGVFGEADGNPLTYSTNPSPSVDATTHFYYHLSDLEPYWNRDDWYCTERTTRWQDYLSQHYNESAVKDNISLEDATVTNEYNIVSNKLISSEYVEEKYYPDYYSYRQNRYTNTTRTHQGDSTAVWTWKTGGVAGIGATTHTTEPVYVPTYRFQFFYRDCLRNNSYYPEIENDTIFDYMTVVSSTYQQASSFDANWYNKSRAEKENSDYNTAISSVRGERGTDNYYMAASDAKRLNTIFVNIASEASYSGSTISIDESNSFLQDVISPAFDKSNATVTAKTYVGTQKVINGAITFDDNNPVDDIPQNKIGWVGNKLKVGGFNYSENYIAYGKNASGNLGPNQGKKIVVTIEGLVPNDTVDGSNLLSNDSNSGIIKMDMDESTSTETETVLEEFISPTIARHKYILNVGSEDETAVFGINYSVSPKDDYVVINDKAIVLRNAVEAKRYDQETAGVIVAKTSSGSTSVGKNNTVYVEFITSGGAEGNVNPADYKLAATVTPASSDATDYTYYLSTQNYLDEDSEQTADNELSNPNVNPASLSTTENGNLYITSKHNNHDVTILNQTVQNHEQAEDYSDSTKKFPIQLTLTKSGSSEFTSKTVTGINQNNEPVSVTFTNGVAVVDLAHNESVKLSLPVGYGVEVADATPPTAYTTTYKVDAGDFTQTAAETDTNANRNIVVKHERNKETIATTGMDETNGSHIILYILAGLAVISGGAGTAYVYRKKDEFVER